MVDSVQSIASATAGAAAQNVAAENARSSSNQVISSDFQTFLEMLTAQMTNQDPLNPIDSSDYAVQLATFSSVEQQVLTNDLLNAMIAQMSQSGISELAGWVGMEARSSAPVHFDGIPLTLSPLPALLADESWLVVRDQTGAEVSRNEIGTSGGDIQWAGTDSNGNLLPSGVYSIEVENHANGSLLGSTPVEHYAHVTEAQNINGQLLLVLDGVVPVLAADINALREPL
ncbi:flagellar hook capping FlgD N-terminal domain-containing protein [Alisedimentitalea sp. MJ-SS2]|uniref:flagellar hook capping FlgD N-terminal domain-containing protein n=1 Tax=Aliisedimentitalea sp. MJ-SS2 TaxID=3049795 RepID=UPI00290B2564|nr:flagellar hook capping FlgD N-terminal domain-containing protein [Alisedimentitalea sp. MJ-SS2]MDU8929618.1 flagellar hook capping FlgD N-terminal domain-containing protein [Alisedimentitalea sp. MJ-SS2]